MMVAPSNVRESLYRTLIVHCYLGKIISLQIKRIRQLEERRYHSKESAAECGPVPPPRRDSSLRHVVRAADCFLFCCYYFCLFVYCGKKDT